MGARKSEIVGKFANGLALGSGLALSVIAVTVAYAALNYAVPMNAAVSGSGVSASEWNKIVANVGALDTQLATTTASANTASTNATNALAKAVPTGAVMAFNLTACPTGWSEYTQAYGRVIRGIDKSGTAIDPDGQRAPGAIQNDSLQNHTHYMVGESGGQDNIVAEQDSNTDSTFAPAAGTSRGDAYIYVGYGKVGNFTSETRGRNVALLYCVKS